MKRNFVKYLFLLVVLVTIAETVDAQRTSRRRTQARRNNNANRANAANNAVVDTIPKQKLVVVNADDKKILPSLRNDNAVERNLIKDRVPLAFEHIREDDAVYRTRVWREIDVHEKMNLAFVYDADEDNGNQQLISILLEAIKKKEVVAFSNIDDRFTTPLADADLQEQIGGKADTIEVVDVTDPKGLRTIKTVTFRSFNPDDVISYRLKEEWVFDKESSRMHVRLLGIAPVVNVRASNGDLIGQAAMFWLYYPDLRAALSKAEAYNPKNYGARMTWEEMFESGFYSSYITKSTLDNPRNARIKDYIKDPILQLLEGDAIKEKIFNYEQDLWSY
jgi:gliding motility associated protien GldN